MPIFGWVVAQEDAFIKAKITCSMNVIAPLPAWVMQELGWREPEYAAIIDGSHTSI